MIQIIEFIYLYRDQSNYKSWGEIYLNNLTQLPLPEIEKKIRSYMMQEELFIAHDINIPELFSFINNEITEDDHCFHEFNSIEEVTGNKKYPVFSSVEDFINKVKKAHENGWSVFDPLSELAIIRNRNKIL